MRGSVVLSDIIYSLKPELVNKGLFRGVCHDCLVPCMLLVVFRAVAAYLCLVLVVVKRNLRKERILVDLDVSVCGNTVIDLDLGCRSPYSGYQCIAFKLNTSHTSLYFFSLSSGNI